MATQPAAPSRHAVVVVHGLGIDQKPGSRLAETANAVGRLIEEYSSRTRAHHPAAAPPAFPPPVRQNSTTKNTGIATFHGQITLFQL